MPVDHGSTLPELTASGRHYRAGGIASGFDLTALNIAVETPKPMVRRAAVTSFFRTFMFS